MVRRSPTTKFVGTTEECFAALFANRSDTERLALRKLIADFCDVQTTAVSRWERGRESVRGMSLLRLRCFLHLAGYEVREVDGYSELRRTLLLAIGLGVIEDPYAVQARLGYGTPRDQHDLKSLYRIILHNKNYSEGVGDELIKLCDELRDKLSAALAEKGREVRRALEMLTVEPQRLVASSPSSPVESLNPLTVTAFVRSVGLTLALGTPLTGNPAAIQAVLQATRGGMDLRELKLMLEGLLG
jgi:hypothetical protein